MNEPRIVYQIGPCLYINLTNRCTAECVFCDRKKKPVVRGYNLGLEHEPTVDEIMAAVGDPSPFLEVVFCGYGEPTLRLETVKEIARQLKAKGAFIRLNTNGHGNLIHGTNIVPELVGLIDAISVSLNAESTEKYDKICRPEFGNKTYEAVIDFIYECRKYLPRVAVSVVGLPAVDAGACREIAKELGVEFKLRELGRVG